jgi:hypothetical protein
VHEQSERTRLPVALQADGDRLGQMGNDRVPFKTISGRTIDSYTIFHD